MARQDFPTTDFLELSTHPAFEGFQAPLTLILIKRNKTASETKRKQIKI